MLEGSVMLILIAVAVFAVMFTLQVLGFRYGKRKRSGQEKEDAEGVGVVEGAVFALLGLMLAFQFGGAASRLGDRRDLAIKEANAIGTAYLRLDLLKPEVAAELRQLFRQYVESRVRATEAMPDLDAARQEHRESEKIAQRIWDRAIAACKSQPGREAELLLLPAINEMIDLSAERKAVGQTHAPWPVQAFLVLLSLQAALVAGNAMSRSPRQPLNHMLLFAAVIAVTIYFIIDMEYPRLGFIRIGAADQPLYDLRDSIK